MVRYIRPRAFLRAAALLAVLASANTSIAQEVPRVVASIPPVHSIAAAVMQGVGEPQLLLEGGSSPHTASLKPSQAQMLENARVIFWVGPVLEAFLEKPLGTIGANAKDVELMDVSGITLLKPREGGTFEAHHHDDGEMHEEHASHRESEDEEHHGHADAEHEAGHDEDGDEHHEAHAEEHHDEHHGEHEVDAHIWLNPENARLFARAMADSLGEADPENAEAYAANAAAFSEKLDALSGEIAARLKPLHGKGFVVFHDAYHYFEDYFDLEAAGSITVSPEVMPGAARLKEIRKTITDLNAACVFAEPQFEPALVRTAIESTSAKQGVLDPVGASIKPGPGLYFTLLRNMADSLSGCLSQ